MDYNTNFEILRENLSNTDPEFDPTKSFRCNELRPIEEIPLPYQQVFAGYPNFNLIQSKVLDDVFYTDESLVISAPTGSGKTTIFELAILRLLVSLEYSQRLIPFKIVYICPMKALCEERVVDWHKKFSNFGINVIAVTGDSENVEFQDLLNHNLIVTTPEKWDCLTRKWTENIKLVQTIKLFMIDEIHFLAEEERGSSLEAIVCRMKNIQELVDRDQADVSKIRFIAVSATVPNIDDVASWLSKSAKCYKFTDEYRPVKLNRIVLGYNYAPNSTPFKFDLSLNYKLNSLIMQYSHGKPTLIFCGTRNNVEMTAKHILQNLTINLKPEQKECLLEASNSISDVKLKETLVHGIGYHHAGMLLQTRRVIENLFKNSDLPILVTTSTLAMGVNLPAHLVIIKSTKCYCNGGFRDYTETALLQMIGRAGRPQFDTEATALILTTTKDKEKFEKMIGGLDPIESNLHRHLTEHLNAEVALQTITNLDVALRWLSSTFLYIRARKNPRYYGLTSADPAMIDRKLLEMCQIELNKLIKAGMLTIDQDVLLKATPVGSAMAKYYLALKTMKLFTQITGYEILQQILVLISKCHEFSEMYLRVNDKKCLNLLNKCRNGQTIRFPLNGKIKTIDMKINCIIQAVLGCLDICDHSILSETLKTMKNGQRIVKCLIEYLESKDKCFQALLSVLILAKCFKVKLWENSPYVSKQLPGIGNVMSSQLVKAGKTTFQLIAECNPREIEMIINKKPPMGAKILYQINHLPKYLLKLELLDKNHLKVTVSLKNCLDLKKSCTVNPNSLMYLLVGDTSNEILLYEKYSHSFFIENTEVVRHVDLNANQLEDIEGHFISEDWVGIDTFLKLEVIPKSEKPKEATDNVSKSKKAKSEVTYMQSFMDMYLKSKKKTQDKGKDYDLENNKVVNESEKDDCTKNTETDNNKIIIQANITIVDKTDNKIQETNNNNSKPKCMENITSTTDKENVTESTLNEEENENQNISEDFPLVKYPIKNNASPRKNNEYQNSLLKKYQFTPRKQLTSCISNINLETHQKLSQEPPIKKRNFEEKSKSNLKITWRSPLTYSPPVKFSPKINYSRLNSSNTEINCSSPSSSSTIGNTGTKHLNQTQNSLRTPVNYNSQSKIIFPLSDKDYAESSIEEISDKQSEILDKLSEIACLENFGFSSFVEKRKGRSQIKTPNEYYHQLLTQSQQKQNAKVSQKLISQVDKMKDKNKCTLESVFESPVSCRTTRSDLKSIRSSKEDSEDDRLNVVGQDYRTDLLDNVENNQTQTHYFLQPQTQVSLQPSKLEPFPPKTQSSRKRSFSDCSSIKQRNNLSQYQDELPFFNTKEFNDNLGKSDDFLSDFDEFKNPFDDSLESALKNYNIPSQNETSKSLSRRGSRNFVELEEIEKDPYKNRHLSTDIDYLTNISSRVINEKINSGFKTQFQCNKINDSPQKFSFGNNTERFLSPKRSQFNSAASYMSYPIQRAPVPPIQNFSDFERTPFQDISNVYQTSRHFVYPDNVPNNFNFTRTQNIGTPCRSSYLNPYSDSGFNESYQYLRTVMENENNQVLAQNIPQVNLNNYPERQRFYPMPLGTPQRPNSYFDFDSGRTSHGEPNYFPSRERTNFPLVESQLPTSSPQVNTNNYYYPFYQQYSSDKNYLMHKFLNGMDSTVKHPNFYD